MTVYLDGNRRVAQRLGGGIPRITLGYIPKWYASPVRFRQGKKRLGATRRSAGMLGRRERSTLLLACLVALSFASELAADPQPSTRKPIEVTITQLIESGAKFNNKRVRVSASFHSDGIERTLLREPNCGRPNGTKTPAQGEPQCSRGVVPRDSGKAENDPGNADLDRTFAQSPLLGTMDKHITAEFTGIFRCVPSCASPKYFSLEIERVENLKVEMKDLKPHPPND